MNVIPIKRVLKLKPMDRIGIRVIHKACCCVRGDQKKMGIDFDPYRTYDMVESHEAFRTLQKYAAYIGLIVEGGDIENAYMYGKKLTVPKL